MKHSRLARFIYQWLVAFGVNPLRTGRAILALPSYLLMIPKMYKSAQRAGCAFSLHPCLDDRFNEAGYLKGHYFIQDLIVAQEINKRAPEKHLDVGSRIDGFVAHVASFRIVEVWDLRGANMEIPNILFRRVDLLDIPSDELGSHPSVSCLHTIEHIGLGRYGDTFDPGGHLKAVCALCSLLANQGTLYLSFPIGKKAIEFNAHRVISWDEISTALMERIAIEKMWLIDDDGMLHGETSETIAARADLLRYGCLIVVGRKR